MEVYDVVIVGAGPAGLNAAVYAARYMLKTLVIGEIRGGTAGEAYEVCNFLTYGKIRGFELAQKMLAQVEELGVEIKPAKVTKISKGELFEVETADKVYFAKRVIVATGTEKRRLNVENEMRLIGRGVSYCATCDGAFFKDKVVAVVGGSDAALTAALMLSEYATKVYIIYRRDRFRAEPAWIKLVEARTKIEPVFNANVRGLIGEQKLEEIVLDTGKKLKVDGLFVEIGALPNSKVAADAGAELEDGYIKTDAKQRTCIPGLFAAGDVSDSPLKQIIVAASEGAIAARTAYDEIVQE